MQGWAESNPRMAGVLVIVLGGALGAMNLAMLVYDNHYYPVLFPVAGACAVAGSLQAVTGVRARRASPMPERAAAMIAAFFGMGLGVAANWLLTGSAL